MKKKNITIIFIVTAVIAIVIIALCLKPKKVEAPVETPTEVEEDPVASEQVYKSDSLGFRFSFPAGWYEFKTEEKSATDTTCRGITVKADSADVANFILYIAADEFAGTTHNITQDLMRQAKNSFDKGVLVNSSTVKVGNLYMLKTIGRRSDFPGFVTNLYQIAGNNGTIFAFCYSYKADTFDERADRAGDVLVSRFEMI
jgi:hypothetical protein